MSLIGVVHGTARSLTFCRRAVFEYDSSLK